jgi:GNAT superfamily N-acetyltransferase
VSRSLDEPKLEVETWPTRAGTLIFPALDRVSAAQRVAAVMSAVEPGSAVVLADQDVRDGLLAEGAQQIRHVHTMRHHLNDVPAARPAPGVILRTWQAGDAELLARAMVAAYGPGHPDARGPDLGEAAESLANMVDDPDNPLMERATQVAVVEGRPVAAAVVVRSDHVAGWMGPWLMNMFRAPDPMLPGIGTTVLTRSLEILSAEGAPHLGLAVTDTNPARRLYKRLGFEYDFEGWILVLPGGGALDFTMNDA